MRFLVRKTVFACYFLLACFAVNAQMQARFSASKTGGCSPLVVAFTNQTTGAGASASYAWDLGNGNRSTDANPSAIYTEEKAYTVTLTVTEGALTSRYSQTVTVYKKPTISLSADKAKGCAPLNITLSAQAAAGDGVLQSWFWDFGDGQTQGGPNLSSVPHTFTFAQQATVSLTVQNSVGCQATVVSDSIVNVLPTLEASFQASQTVLCRITDPVTLTNTSKGPGNLTYQWAFGDGGTSTVTSPSHVYNSRGTYAVSLTVNSSEGCTATKTVPSFINAANYQSDIIMPNLSCTSQETKFMSQSSPAPQYTEWDVQGYGTGWSPYGSNSALYYFYTTGANRVRLVNTFGTCKDTVEKTFTIHRSLEVRGFVKEKSTECGAPASVQFRDTTAGAVKWQWNFNCQYNCPTTDATIQAPVKTFDIPSQYYISLKVTNAAGCTTDFYDVLDLQKPQLYIDLTSSTATTNWRHGCLGLTLGFKASRPDDVASYKWIFSDDASTSTEAQPVHSFNKEGTFRVTLNYVLKNGCTGTVLYDDIRVRAKPKLEFASTSGTTICGNTPVRFEGQSGGNQDWYWHFGDGTVQYVYGGTINTAEHKYEKEGVYTVTLIGQAEGCFDTLEKKAYLVVKPPFPKIAGFRNTCDGTRGEVTFLDGSRQAESWHWDFGDGTSTQYTTPPAEITHTYAKTGSYKAVLTTTNGGCTVKDSLQIPVLLKQKPIIKSSQTLVCSNQGLEFVITGMEANHKAYYNWAHYYSRNIEFGTGGNGVGNLLSLNNYDPGPDMKFRYLNLDRGENKFRFILQSDYFNCLDTTDYFTINVKGPVAGLTASANYCSGNLVNFTDTSKATGGVPIVSRFWSFGDGQQALNNGGGPVSHLYPYTGNFDVTLTVTDAEGCSDQKGISYMRVGGLDAAFRASATTVSPNTSVTFQNTTFDNYSYSTSFRWIFGDGSTSTERDPQHTYTQPGTYEVLLLATNSLHGCTDTARQTIVVKYINSAFDISTTYLHNTSCPPVVARFTNKSMNAARMVWEFGDGARAENVLHPTHLYTAPGTYRVTLRTYSDNGTEYVTVDSVKIRAASSASLLSDQLMACTSGAIRFSAPGDKAATYTWDFGDGTVRQTTDSLIQYPFSRAGIYRPSLVTTDAGGCVAGAKLESPVVIDSLQIAIGNLPSACNSVQVQFQPSVHSVAATSGGPQVLRYHWNFGTGIAADTANTASPLFLYSQPGVYTVRFSVSSPSGCFKEVTRQVVVDQKIRGVITGPDALCEGGSAQFSATAPAGTPLGWNFGQGGTAGITNPPAQVYTRPGDYNVLLTTTNGACTDTTVHRLTVHPKPLLQLPQPQVALCAGGTVQLSATGGATYQWQPATGLSNAAVANPVASPSITTTYNVTAQSLFGCTNTAAVTVTVAPAMNLQVAAGTTICQGASVQLAASGAATYQWIGNTQGLSSTAIANPVAAPATTTTYQVKATDAARCFTDTAEVVITVAPLPTVNAGPDVILSGGNSHTLQPSVSADVVAWTWMPQDYLSCATCPAPVATPAADMTYTVTVRNSQGCTATDAVKIITQCGESRIFIPDAFTPNGDAKNPTFRIRGSGVKAVKAFTVYNRWGETVFQKQNFQLDDASAAWDGKFRGQRVPEGSYVYFASFLCTSGEVFTKKGTVTVVY